MHPEVIDLLQDALDLHTFCDSEGRRSCVIGDLAVQRWAQPRMTRDVDLALLAGFGQEELFIDALLKRFPSRRTDARDFALKNRVLLLSSMQGTGLDLSLAALPIARASLFSFAPGFDIRT